MVSKTALVVCLLSGYTIASPRSDYSGHYIQPETQTSWGSWGHTEWCPHGTFANKFDLKIESDQGSDDDTALNAIRLYCSRLPACSGSSGPSKWIFSKRGSWGDWWREAACYYGHVLVGARARSERSQGSRSDDTAVNSYRFQCRDPKTGQTNEAYSYDGFWGSWSSTKYCPSGTAICGLQTRVEDPQGGSGDDTALNDAKFYCCNLPFFCNF